MGRFWRAVGRHLAWQGDPRDFFISIAGGVLLMQAVEVVTGPLSPTLSGAGVIGLTLALYYLALRPLRGRLWGRN